MFGCGGPKYIEAIAKIEVIFQHDHMSVLGSSFSQNIEMTHEAPARSDGFETASVIRTNRGKKLRFPPDHCKLPGHLFTPVDS